MSTLQSVPSKNVTRGKASSSGQAMSVPDDVKTPGGMPAASSPEDISVPNWQPSDTRIDDGSLVARLRSDNEALLTQQALARKDNEALRVELKKTLRLLAEAQRAARFVAA